MSYQMGLSFSNKVGIKFGALGTLPLDFDALLVLSTQNLLPQVFNKFNGFLDINGEATGTLIIPGSLGLVGVSFYAAALTYDKNGANFISNGLGWSIHR